MQATSTVNVFSEGKERFPFLTRIFSRTKWSQHYSRKMMAAGLPLKGEEFLTFLLIAIVLCSCGLAIVIKQWFGFLVGGFLGLYLPNFLLNWRIGRRKLQMEYQLADALSIISAGLSAGYSFLQGTHLAAQQMPQPISDELERVVRLSSLGMPIEQALQLMAERVQSYDYDITVSAIMVQLRRGGNLSRILGVIVDTIRKRQELRGEIAASTAQARLSGWILMALPFGVAVIVSFLNPQWMKLLIDTDLGHKMIWAGLFMQSMGMIWIRKLIQVEL